MSDSTYGVMVLMVSFGIAVPATLIFLLLIQIRDALGRRLPPSWPPPPPAVEHNEYHLHVHYHATPDQLPPPVRGALPVMVGREPNAADQPQLHCLKAHHVQ
jgi:hypothetical protein